MARTEVLKQIPRVDWGNAIDAVFLSHVWFGNWSFLQLRSWIYHVFQYVAVLAIAGLVVLLVGCALGRGARFAFLRSPGGLGVLAAVYGFFWIGILYHVLITFVAQGVSASQGWYLYGVVVAEVLLGCMGLLALAPRRLNRWVLPAAGTALGLLDLYTVHFLFIPYYSGFIAHKANGALATFYASQLFTIPWLDVAGRLAADEPRLGAAGITMMWAGYLLATAALLLAVFRSSRTPNAP
jgi:hypothetical protein